MSATTLNSDALARETVATIVLGKHICSREREREKRRENRKRDCLLGCFSAIFDFIATLLQIKHTKKFFISQKKKNKGKKKYTVN